MKIEDDLGVLARAAETKDVERGDIISSFRRVEQQSTGDIDPSVLKGKWELIFSSIPGGAANGFVLGGFFNGYFAIKETVDFFALTLESPIGGFTGPSQVASTNPLVIEYEYKEFKFGPIGQEVPPNVRSYTFVYVNDGLAIARIDTGGAVILKQVDSS